MNFPWVIRLAREDAASLAGFRLVDGVEVAEAGTDLWLRGRLCDERLATRLMSLPARARFEWLPSDQLRLIDRRVPSEQLPDLSWQPLRDWLQIERPVAALPGRHPAPVTLRLVRSTNERDPGLLLTTLEEFSRFTAQAALARIERLEFAAAADGRALIRGRPLPPLPGRQFVLHGSIAVPAGYTWEPAVSVEVLTCCFSASGDTLILWNEDGTFVRLHGEQFIPASRGAVRATADAAAQT